MALRTFYNEVKDLKVRQLPSHLKSKLRWSNMKNSVDEATDRYIGKYIETSSVEPLFHVCIGGMIFSYLVALPEERHHLQHHAAAHH